MEVEVRADRGQVRLSGTVYAQRELDAAVRLARQVPGVSAVSSEVQVINAPAR